MPSTIPQHDNTKLLDIKKVRYAWFYYMNQDGSKCSVKPRKPSVHGVFFDENERALAHDLYPDELAIDRAKRLGILDVWFPVLKCELAAHRTLTFTGDKALKLWDIWKGRIYSNASTKENT